MRTYLQKPKRSIGIWNQNVDIKYQYKVNYQNIKYSTIINNQL